MEITVRMTAEEYDKIRDQQKTINELTNQLNVSSIRYNGLCRKICEAIKVGVDGEGNTTYGISSESHLEEALISIEKFYS